MKRPSFAVVGSVSALFAVAVVLLSQPDPGERVGPRRDGGFLLNSGWVLRPAGRQVPLGTFPMSCALSRDKRWVVVLEAGYLGPALSVHDAATLAETARASVPDAWLGLTFAPNSDLLYVGGGSQATVYEFALTPEGQLEKRREFTLIPAAGRKHTDFIGDVTFSPDGRMLYAAAVFRNSIFVVNPKTGFVVGEWKTVRRPYRLLFHPSGKKLFVTGWGEGILARMDAVSGAVDQRLPVGLEPMDMLWRDEKPQPDADAGQFPYPARLFVAAGGTNQVSMFGVSSDASLRLLERINVALTPEQPSGSSPSALSLSGDGDRLYVACADLNAVAAVDVRTAHSHILGFIPTGWYPTASLALPGGRLMVLNGRGGGSFPNPHGPNPSQRTAPVHLGNTGVEYVGVLQKGSASLLSEPTPAELDKDSRVVFDNSRWRDLRRYTAFIPNGSVVPDHPGVASPIKHVIYVLKENRTYDQILGDLGKGNGDPSLTLFGEDVTPNHHKLARDFVLLDNFYVNADVSADGHNWSSAAIAPPYVQRMWPNSYGGRRKHYDYEGGEPAALPPAGYLWTNALEAGLAVRNYGWWTTNITPAPSSGAQIQEVKDASLRPVTNMDYRGFDLEYRDTRRIQVFLDDLHRFEQSGSLPALTLLRLGNDHTSGVTPGKIAPRSAVADNDAALGMLVEGVSRSRFWTSTVIFVLEDDAQNGPDHVDSHRSPAFVISPYTRGRGVDSTMYNTVSVLRTIELFLGLQPMTVYDGGAHVMWAAFNGTPQAAPYDAEKPRIPLDTLNGAGSALNERSRRLDFAEADEADDDELNDILWRAVKGTTPPSPVRSYFGR